MPAPPAAVLDALRFGRGAGHWFFEMDHASGVVRAWDGIGTYVWNGQTYYGVSGVASIAGVSNSAELQNHEVLVTLSSVPLSALQDVTPDVRGRAATLWKVIFDEDLNVIGSRVMFKGIADNMRSRIDDKTMTLIVKLRGKLADWSAAPGRFYTDKDQSRSYPTDTGFKFAKTLENATINGWSKDPETTGGVPMILSGHINDSVTGEVIGSATLGTGVRLLGGTPPLQLNTSFSAGVNYLENGVGASIRANSNTPASPLMVGGVNCYVDIFGDVRTPGGLLVFPTTFSSAAKLRKQTVISANGAAGATSAANFAAQANVIAKAGSGYTLAASNQTDILYDNLSGYVAQWLTGALRAGSTTIAYVEETTGTAVTLSGGNNLQVGGVDCKISANGVLLSTGGRRIVKPPGSGGVAANFLRVWT